MSLPGVRCLLALLIPCVLVVGCRSVFDSSAHDDDAVSFAGQPAPTTMGLTVGQAPAQEEEAFTHMYDAATDDGAISAGELRLFALETAACIRRAGFDATLGDFDPRTGALSLVVEAEDQFDTSGESETDACLETFYSTPWEQFKQDTGSIDEE